MAVTPVDLSVTNITATSVRLNWVRAIWTPIQLFLAGVLGAWFDPSDLSTLFQDAAGTIPVTADGDPVGLMLDKSGNGYHASQSVSGSRPVYRTDGTLHWLEFDGVSSFLFRDAFVWDMSLTTGVSVSVGMEAPPQGDNRLIAEGSSSNNRPIYAPLQSDNIDFSKLTSFARGDSGFLFISQTDMAAGVSFNGSAHVITHKNFSNLATNLTDGVQVASFAYTPTTITLNTFSIGALLRATAGVLYEGKFFGCVISEANDTTDQDSYLASLAGITL